MGKEELYALARGVVGVRCEELERLLRIDGGRLGFGDIADLRHRIGALMWNGVAIKLSPSETDGFLALSAMEWLIEAQGVPWREDGETLSDRERDRRLFASIEELHDYLDDSGKSSLHRMVQQLRGSAERRAAQTAAKSMLNTFAGGIAAFLGPDEHTVQTPQLGPLTNGEPPDPRHSPIEAQPLLVHSTSPLPLTTGSIAFAFAGLNKWDEAQWKKPLGNKPKWIRAAVAINGRQGVHATHWNPVVLGGLLITEKGVAARSVRARFQSMNDLKPWLDEWKTYEADNFDTD